MAQKQLEFKPKDQTAMDRRLRYYFCKSLPNPKKKAAQWLRKHPMDCIARAASKAHCASDEEESSSEDTAKEGEKDLQHDEGTLPENEKEVLRNLPLADFLTESSGRDKSHIGSTPDHSDYNSTADSDDDVSIITLKRALG